MKLKLPLGVDGEKSDMKSELLKGKELVSTIEARKRLSFEQAMFLRALPLKIQNTDRGEVLHVAVSDSSDSHIQKVSFACGIPCIAVQTVGETLQHTIAKMYKENLDELPLPPSTHRETDRPPLRVVPSSEGDVGKFVTGIIDYCAVRKASDIHLIPQGGSVLVRMRLDGVIHNLTNRNYSIALHEQVVVRLKVQAGLDLSQKRLPQDGSFAFSVGSELRHARISIIPSLYGESIVIRLLASSELPTLEALGMEPTGLLLLREALEAQQGMILLTGPTGSGKTTTMYAAAVDLCSRGRNVVSVEDPIETAVQGVVQIQVCTAQSLGYPEAIRAVLRHDPDSLFIGEIRDAVSASIALHASTTGHLTISSVHIGSCLQVIKRMELLGVSRTQSIEPIRLVINQRLLPKLCEACKEPQEGIFSACGRPLYEPRGCSVCNHVGFNDRVLVTEVLDLQSREAKDLFYRQEDLKNLLRELPREAYLPWHESLQYHLARGDISSSQVEAFVE